MDECTRARGALDALIDGELAPGEAETVRAHLAACSACAREHEERKVQSDGLGQALKQAVRVVHSTPEERRDVVVRMSNVSRTERRRWPRAAAAAAVLLAFGLLAWSMGFFGPRSMPAADARPLVRETAERVAEVEASRERYDRLIAELEKMTEEVRAQLPPDAELTPADRTAALELAALEDRVAQICWQGDSPQLPSDPKARVEKLASDLASPHPPTRAIARRSLRCLGADAIPHLESAVDRVRSADRWFLRGLILRLRGGDELARECVEYSRPAGDRKFEFRQFGDAKVEVLLVQDGRPVKLHARSMGDLLKRHGSVCKEYRISGIDGWVSVDGNFLGMDFDGQLDLAFFALEDADFGPYRREAFARVLAGRVKSSKDIETRIVALENQLRRAEDRRVAGQRPDPKAVERVTQNIRAWDDARLRSALDSAEGELRRIQEKLDSASELRGKLGALKVYLQEVRAAAK